MKLPFQSFVVFLFCFFLLLVPAKAAPEADPFTQFCNSLVDSILKRVNSSKEGPIGLKAFEREIKAIFDRQLPKGTPEITSDYMDLIYREWISLGDPAFHLSVLKYPIPEAAADVLGSALANRITPAQIEAITPQFRNKGSSREVLLWIRRLLEHPEKRDGNLLHALVREYKKSFVISQDRIRYLTGIPILPEVKPGHVRMYKGSNFYKGPSISQSQVGKAPGEIGDGGLVFLDQSDANTHSVKAEAFHPDGVSVSTDKTVPINYGSHIRIYEVPIEVVERLPRGAPGLNEYVFKYSVPERFRIGTFPKATYLEILKQDAGRTSSYGELARGFARDSGIRLIGLLHSRAEPILIRGRSFSFSGLMNERVQAFERRSVEYQTLLGLEQYDKYSRSFSWNSIKAPPNVDLRSAVSFSFTLRHSGKPVAESLGGSGEEFTVEVIGQLMKKAGYSKAEVELGQALAGNDIIGAMLQGGISPQEAFEKLVFISKQTNLSPRDYFTLQSFFYSMDVSASPDFSALFMKEGEMLFPKSDKFRVLRNLFENVEIRP